MALDFSTTDYLPPSMQVPIERSHKSFTEEGYTLSHPIMHRTQNSGGQTTAYVVMPTRAASGLDSNIKAWFGNTIDISKWAAIPLNNRWEKVFLELGSLNTTEDFIAPSKETLRDMEAVTRYLSNKVAMPSIDHDDSNGFVSLSWRSAITKTMFSITFTGSNRVVATLVPVRADGNSIWDYKISEEVKIDEMLADENVAQIIGDSCAIV